MTYTEIKEKGKKKYYYRVKSVRKGQKVDKERVYLGGNLTQQELKKKEIQADKELENSKSKDSKTSKIAKKPQNKKQEKGRKVTFEFDKNKDFSNWYTEIIQKAELADLRSNVKGFLVFQPWSVMAMEKMYEYMEKTLQRKGHKPYWFPTLIPESNLKKESNHISGFTPEVFWVTHGGEKKLEERYALRPTSETLF